MRRPVTRPPRYRAGSHWVVVPGGVVFRMRADALPTCVRRARRPARGGCCVLGAGGRASRQAANLGGSRIHRQHRARARRPDPDLGREPRVDRLLAAARVAVTDLAREQQGQERRDPDPADRAELRGVGPPARRSLALRAGHPDVLVRAGPHRSRGRRRPARHARRDRADAGAAARLPVPRDRRVADDGGDRGQPDAAAPPRHDGVGRRRPQRPRTMEGRLAVPAVADPAGRVVRARHRRHQPDLHRADARDDRHRRVPRRAPARRAPVADRRGPHDAVGEGARIPDGADARRPLRPRDGQPAGRRRDRDRQHPPGDARARRDVGRRRPGHRRDPRADRGRHARRRGIRLEPHARPDCPTTGSPTTSTTSPGFAKDVRGRGRERRPDRRQVADQRHRDAPGGASTRRRGSRTRHVSWRR